MALDDLDLAALDQTGQALEQSLDDLALVGVDRADVDQLERAVHPELAGLFDHIDGLGGVQQGLGRDAATVQAGPADLVLLDHDDGHAELGRPKGSGVATAAAPEHDQVDGVGLGHCGSSFIHCASVSVALGGLHGASFHPGVQVASTPVIFRLAREGQEATGR